MGHAYIRNIGEKVLKGIYARGTIKIEAILKACIKDGIYLKASEGDYEDEGMISMGIETQILHLLKQGVIEFAWETDPAENVCPDCSSKYEVLYVYGRENTSGDWNNCDSHIIADRCPKCKDKEPEFYADLNEWIDHVLSEWHDGWKFFGKMKIKFSEGWRKKYPDIPILHDVSN